MDSKKQKTVIIVSHTHWDRAWYLSFQQFRFRLVKMMDRLMDLLEEKPSYHSFTLDGQTILLDDYLEIKPEKKDRLEKLIRSGKLIVGPWYVLPDLFLVSGESVIRNLQMGTKTAVRFGSAMQEGYVPDPFGHFAQLPQILRQFGINSFIFMRGLSKSDVDRMGSVFDWESPDGTKILTVYLKEGYFNSASLGYTESFGRHDGLSPDPVLALNQIKKSIEKLVPFQKETVYLLNNGFDHMPEQPELPELLSHVQTSSNGMAIKHGTYKEFIDLLVKQNIPHQSMKGDLLGNADHPILSSVFSTRVYLKQQNHQAQSYLERYAEPFTWFIYNSTSAPDSGPFMNYAWKLLMQNHPHDDICGCSLDGVHDDDETRFRQVIEIAQMMMIEGMEQILTRGTDFPPPTSERYSYVFLFNPHPWEQKVNAILPVLLANKNAENGTDLPEKALKAIDTMGQAICVGVISTKDYSLRNNFLESTWGRRYDVQIESIVPPLGYKMIQIAETEKQVLNIPDNKSWDIESSGNGFLIRYAETGNIFANPFRFEYQHDNGDTYSFGPVPDKGPWFANFKSLKKSSAKSNSWILNYDLTVPESIGSSNLTMIPILVHLDISPQNYLSINITYQNLASDGRLRIIFPSTANTSTATTDAHFRLAEREMPDIVTPESDPDRYNTYPGELTYPTAHLNDFLWVDDGKIKTWVATRGLHEFELLNSGKKTDIALTLHRSVGLLSTANGRIRRVQAGPSIPVPGAQCIRKLTFDVAFGLNNSDTGSLIRLAKGFSHPVWAREMPWLPHLMKKGELESTKSILSINNPFIQLSAFRRNPDTSDTTLRIYNISDKDQSADINISQKSGFWCISDLNEHWNNAKKQTLQNGNIRVVLKPHQILTILIR